MPPELGHAVLHHANVLLDLGQQDSALDASHQESSDRVRLDLGREGPGRLGPRQGRGQALAPALEPAGQPLAEALVGIRQLGGEVADGAAADTVPGPLGGQDLVEERLDLVQRRARDIPEDRGEGARLKSREQPVEDRVPEVLFGPEMVIEIAFSSTALPEDVVERGPMVAPDGHQTGGDLEDLLLDGGSTRRHGVYRPVGTLA